MHRIGNSAPRELRSDRLIHVQPIADGRVAATTLNPSCDDGRKLLDELRARIERREITTVVCATPDLWGRLVGKRLTANSFLEVASGHQGLHASAYLFCNDMEMLPRDGYSLTSSDQGFQDFAMVPDLKTIKLPPWQPATAFVLCDAISSDGTPLNVAPRNILKRQIERAARSGFSFKCASELEFFLFNNSYEEAWDSRYLALTPTSRYRADYHILQSSRDEPFIGHLRDMMCAVGIEVESAKPEWGLGQQEVTLKYAPALEMADRHLLYKAWVKELAAQRGLSATFMAKPFIDEVGSSCHIHVSLWDVAGTSPLSFDSGETGRMSSTFGAFVAGLVAGGRSYAWMVAPSVNSYKRFRKNSFAPIQLVVGNDNRTCGYRLVGHAASFRVESRVPGADVNPYLALAGTIASGLDGIEDGLPTPSLYTNNPYNDEALPRIPTTMKEAIDEFSKSERALASLGPEVHAHLLNFARGELNAFEQETVTDWEMMRYFERI